MNKRIVVALGAAGLLLLCAIGVLGVGWYLAAPLFIDDVVEEAFPTEVPSASELAAMSDEERAEIMDDVLEAAADMPDIAMAEAMPDGGPTLLLSGSFVDADDFHQGSGSAGVYALEDGSRVLRLEDFMVTNGPDLHVLLAESSGELGDYVDLGSLKGNIGSQNYDIPAGVDLANYGAVVIYCVPFHVLFSSAALG